MDASDRTLAVIARSVVKPAAHYADYRELLRFDFWYSCAYCTMTEVEAMGFRFTIDHYEPKSIRQDLIADFGNLLWACDRCNTHKGDVCPSEEDRAKGHRFFRPDKDNPYEHMELAGLRLVPRSPTGEFTIEVLYLNCQPLREIRRMRQEFFDAAEQIHLGIRALGNVAIDQLKPSARARFLAVRRRIEGDAAALDAAYAADILRQFNRSPLLDRDPDAINQTKVRREYLKKHLAMLP